MAAIPLQNMISQESNFTKGFRRREMRLGDGFSSRVQDGLNSTMWQSTLVYPNLTTTEYTTLRTFIDGIGSWGTFDYTPPGSSTSVKWSINPDGMQVTPVSGDHYTVTIACRQEWDLA